MLLTEGVCCVHCEWELGGLAKKLDGRPFGTGGSEGCGLGVGYSRVLRASGCNCRGAGRWCKTCVTVGVEVLGDRSCSFSAVGLDVGWWGGDMFDSSSIIRCIGSARTFEVQARSKSGKLILYSSQKKQNTHLPNTRRHKCPRASESFIFVLLSSISDFLILNHRPGTLCGNTILSTRTILLEDHVFSGLVS